MSVSGERSWSRDKDRTDCVQHILPPAQPVRLFFSMQAHVVACGLPIELPDMEFRTLNSGH